MTHKGVVFRYKIVLIFVNYFLATHFRVLSCVILRFSLFPTTPIQYLLHIQWYNHKIVVQLNELQEEDKRQAIDGCNWHCSGKSSTDIKAIP